MSWYRITVFKNLHLYILHHYIIDFVIVCKLQVCIICNTTHVGVTGGAFNIALAHPSVHLYVYPAVCESANPRA